MTEDKIATLEDLKRSYNKIFYKAMDGNFYKLANYYPLHFNVENRPDCIGLDTGGPMEDCDFGIFKVEEGKLLREEDSGKEFRQVSPKLIIR